MAVALVTGLTAARGYNVISDDGAVWSWAATGTIAARAPPPSSWP